MDWIKTNSVEKEWARGDDYHRDWASRTQRDDPIQRPVAYEWMIDLCNRTRCHLWITVPHVVDDDYVASLARLIRTRLSPDLQCYVEWSNETWNGMFSQAHTPQVQCPAGLGAQTSRPALIRPLGTGPSGMP